MRKCANSNRTKRNRKNVQSTALNSTPPHVEITNLFHQHHEWKLFINPLLIKPKIGKWYKSSSIWSVSRISIANFRSFFLCFYPQNSLLVCFCCSLTFDPIYQTKIVSVSAFDNSNAKSVKKKMKYYEDTKQKKNATKIYLYIDIFVLCSQLYETQRMLD